MSERLCWMHNPGQQPLALYELALPIGNIIQLCAECCAWWRLDAAAHPDDVAAQPVWIRDINSSWSTT